MISRLTIERPDIWQRGLEFATGLTGYLYLPKLPAPDGTIFACGGYPFTPPTLKERIKIKRERLDWLKKQQHPGPVVQLEIEELEESLRDLEQNLSPSVVVPDGAMEWLLHEVGHWIAASPEERQLPNYGDGHEVEAWAFEEIVLGHLGPARHFAPPSQRDGTAFDLAGPIPSWAFRHIDRQMAGDRVAVEQFRLLWSEWAEWGASLGHAAPWSTTR